MAHSIVDVQRSRLMMRRSYVKMPPRIVSMIASATEIVHSVGRAEYQVGRSHECDSPASVSSLPVVTRPRFDVHGTSQEIDARVRETLALAGSVYEVLSELMDPL